jgi:hypothetical protein
MYQFILAVSIIFLMLAAISNDDCHQPGSKISRHLLKDQSTDIRNSRLEWRRFWTDQPTHLTPERIHGGLQ